LEQEIEFDTLDYLDDVAGPWLSENTFDSYVAGRDWVEWLVEWVEQRGVAPMMLREQ
jgi:hypothetical protein